MRKWYKTLFILIASALFLLLLSLITGYSTPKGIDEIAEEALE